MKASEQIKELARRSAEFEIRKTPDITNEEIEGMTKLELEAFNHKHMIGAILRYLDGERV